MADSEKPKTGPPESPTTARELDFDDDDVPTSPKLSKPLDSTSSPAPKTGGAEAAPPPQPPRPMNPQEQAEMTLREAFPSIDAGVVKAVLIASGGNVEPAFNALLGMTDPESQHEAAPPAPPPRPTSQTRSPASRSQLEQDEIYARQLAEHYQHQEAKRQSARQYRQDQQERYHREREEPERSFLDDDLPEIGENIKKGFLETQTKVNSFFANLKKKFDEDDEDTPPPQPPRRPSQQYGRRSNDYTSRRSTERERYDGDAAEIGDDFTALQLNDNDPPNRKSNRPQANPDLFKPTPTTPSDGRRVSFQEGPPEEISDDLYRRSPDPTNRPSSTASGNKSSKWQPLNTVDPSPVADHDPFSLGDSDDEESKKKDIKPEDTERLKKATAEAMSEELGSPGAKGDRANKGSMQLREAGLEGTKNKEAEEKLTGKS